ncbi:WRKY transcription factor 22 [Dichanthelium oligosanthes]|uniref:WRKY transcription factor 22 n=1 Tax=Dichanthelium oligosanthes TaxID=888268 RepID=A0A1E5VLE7_9POAL|nr:WRKY transcription factor 22 [Dichanthelium oligosanthes]
MEEERCFNNWDLDAVVRLGCRRLSPPRQADNPFAAFQPPQPQPHKEEKAAVPAPAPEADAGWRFPDPCAGGGQDGDELLRALLAAQPPLPQPLPTPPSPSPQPPPPPQRQQQPVDVPPRKVHAAPASPLARAHPSGRQVAGGVPRCKRRKNQVKKVVCQVPVDGSSSDVWAWRKYGQKPIKGSPYPRGYYRCSSSKGCAARKQVERSRSDPNTFILTYTGEHNHAAPTHRNSLAGTTRHKLPSSASPQPPSVVVGGASASAGDAEPQPQQPSPSRTSRSTAGLSPTTPLRSPSMEEDDEEENDELLVEDRDGR